MGVTPGTWYVRAPYSRCKRPAVAAPGVKSICVVKNPADAALISAAPEMLLITRLVAGLPVPHEDHADDTPVFGVNGHYITVGDVRHARAILEKIRTANP